MDPQPEIPPEQEYVYSHTKRRKIPLIIAAVVFIAVVGLIGYAGIRNNSLSPTSYSLPTPQTIQNTPTSTASPSPAVAGYNNYEGGFSFKHPVPPHCNGCYDDPGGAASKIPGIWIVSYENGLHPTDTDWAISVQKLPNELKGSYSSVTIPTKQFFDIVTPLKIDETVPLAPDVGGGSFTITRKKNIAIESRIANLYQSTYSARGLARTKYIVFPSADGASTYVAEVEWSAPSNDSIFGLFTLSFQQTLLPESEVRNPKNH